MPRPPHPCVRTCLVGLLALLAAGPAWAHKVRLSAHVDETTVHTESTFSDGRRVAGGRIEVLDRAGAVLLKGVTDPQGHFSFPLPDQQDLTIVLNDGMGHRDRLMLKGEAPAPPGR